LFETGHKSLDAAEKSDIIEYRNSVFVVPVSGCSSEQGLKGAAAVFGLQWRGRGGGGFTRHLLAAREPLRARRFPREGPGIT
jgi:hypothetical protein